MKNTNNLYPPASTMLAGEISDSLSFLAGGEFDGDRDAGGAIELTGPAVVVGGKNIVFAVGGRTVEGVPSGRSCSKLPFGMLELIRMLSHATNVFASELIS